MKMHWFGSIDNRLFGFCLRLHDVILSLDFGRVLSSIAACINGSKCCIDKVR